MIVYNYEWIFLVRPIAKWGERLRSKKKGSE